MKKLLFLLITTMSLNFTMMGQASSFGCNDLVQVSVDENCVALITPDMILEGDEDYANFEVRIYTEMPNPINSPGTVNNPVGLGHYIVGVFEISSGNNCWGEIDVLDKLAPVIECNCPEGGEYPAGSVVPTTITGNLTSNDLTADIHKNCWDFGTDDQLPAAGNHYFDKFLIEVSVSGTYSFDGTDGNRLILGIYDNAFNAVETCDNLIDGMGGIAGGVYEEPTNGGVIDNTVNLVVGHTYTVIVTDFDNNFFGDYSFSIIPPNSGEVTFAKTVYSDECEFLGCFDEETDYNFPLPDFHDNCSADLTWTQTVEDGIDCGTYIVKRYYTVTDGAGLTAECTSEYFFKGIDVTNLHWPSNWDGLPNNNPMLECDEGYDVDALGNPDPGFTGVPDGFDDACGTIEVFYNDQVYNLECGIKILRYWTLVDDCTGTIYEHTQIIRITDTKVPEFNKPDDIEAKTKAYVCNADIEVPVIQHLSDNCDDNPQWWITTNAGIIVGDNNFNGFVDANETWFIVNVPLGSYDVCYHAIDNCGNEEIKCINLTVFDGIPPIPVCEQHKQVSLTAMGHAKVWAWDFDSGSFDNCNPVYFKVLRVNDDLVYDGGCPDLNGDDNPATGNNDVWYDDDVFFCCDDVNNDIMVSLRVFDKDPGVGPVSPSRMLPGGDLYGHYNDCWSVVHLENKIPPILDCPPLIVDCEESLDPEENPSLWPNVISVCGYELDYSDNSNLGVCGAKIVRTWTATSGSASTQCKQRITVEATHPFDPCTIRFPNDVKADCASELNDGGEPVWDENPCNVVTAEIVKEDTFTFVDGACYKIIREWAVIDWCVYEANTGAEDNLDVIKGHRLNCEFLVEDGYYRYTQILMVTDSEAPEIQVEDACIATLDCYSYNTVLTAHATDSCNVLQKFNWKYIVTSMDTWETIQYSYNYTPHPSQGRKGRRSLDNLDNTADASLTILDPLPIGNYRVIWTVGDGCGNATSKTQYFSVADKKPPTPIFVDLATAVMNNGMVELTARSFDKGGCGDDCISSYDNCSDSEHLYFTFTPVLPSLWDQPLKWNKQLNHYGKYFFDPETGAISTEAAYLAGNADAWLPDLRTAQRVYLCDFVEDSNFTKTIKVYVWDQFAMNEECDDGNYEFANVEVNFNHCGSDPNPLVSGTVTLSGSNIPADNMEIIADNGENKILNKTDDQGYYAFNLSNGNYSITGKSNVNYLQGISTLDLVIIQKHLLGMKEITDPYKMIAADVNNNGSVAASDLLEIRKLILGSKNSFANDSWIAINKDYVFENPANALAEAKKATVRKISVNNQNISDLNFIAVKVGDMNDSALNGLESRNAETLQLGLDDIEISKGVETEIPFYANDFNNIFGMQFSMNISGLEIKDITSGALEINESNINIIDNEMVLSWNNAHGVTANDGDILFTVTVKSNTNTRLSNILNINDNIARSEIYAGNDLDVKSLSLNYRNTNTSYALYQNEPNPFTQETMIGFDLPETSNYTLKIYDMSGKELIVRKAQGTKGHNTVKVSKKDLNITGVLYYRLESGDFTATRKMIILK